VLTIGKTIHLELIDDNKEYKDKYRAKVVEMSNHSFFIEFPVNQRTKKTDFFRDGEEFLGSIVTENESVYQFPTKLIDRTVRKIPMLEMTLPDEADFVKIQRRAYVRVDFITDVSVQSDRQGKEYVSSTMSNISGGGMSIVLPSTFKIQVDDVITCQFRLPCNAIDEEFEEDCKVVRLGKTTDEQRKVYLYFINIKESERKKLIQFCFQKQLEQRRKGL